MTVDSAVPRDSRARVEQILAAALTVFITDGVAGSSMSEISRLSGASIGSIYHHFSGKDDIAGALYLDGLTAYQDGMLVTLGTADDTRTGVEEAVRHHLRWISCNADLARFLLLGRDASVVVATEAPLRERNRSFFRAVSDWTQPRVGAGELAPFSPEVMTALWIGPAQEFARGWLARRGRRAMAEAEAALPPAAWRTLAGPLAAEISPRRNGRR